MKSPAKPKPKKSKAVNVPKEVMLIDKETDKKLSNLRQRKKTDDKEKGKEDKTSRGLSTSVISRVKGCRQSYCKDHSQKWKTCYKKSAFKLHPDKGGDEDGFKRLTGCNDDLSELPEELTSTSDLGNVSVAGKVQIDQHNEKPVLLQISNSVKSDIQKTSSDLSEDLKESKKENTELKDEIKDDMKTSRSLDKQLQQTMDQVENVDEDNAKIKEDLSELTQDTNKQITEAKTKGDKNEIKILGIQYENKVKKMQVLFKKNKEKRQLAEDKLKQIKEDTKKKIEACGNSKTLDVWNELHCDKYDSEDELLKELDLDSNRYKAFKQDLVDAKKKENAKALFLRGAKKNIESRKKAKEDCRKSRSILDWHKQECDKLIPDDPHKKQLEEDKRSEILTRKSRDLGGKVLKGALTRARGNITARDEKAKEDCRESKSILEWHKQDCDKLIPNDPHKKQLEDDKRSEVLSKKGAVSGGKMFGDKLSKARQRIKDKNDREIEKAKEDKEKYRKHVNENAKHFCDKDFLKSEFGEIYKGKCEEYKKVYKKKDRRLAECKDIMEKYGPDNEGYKMCVDKLERYKEGCSGVPSKEMCENDNYASTCRWDDVQESCYGRNNLYKLKTIKKPETPPNVNELVEKDPEKYCTDKYYKDVKYGTLYKEACELQRILKEQQVAATSMTQQEEKREDKIEIKKDEHEKITPEEKKQEHLDRVRKKFDEQIKKLAEECIQYNKGSEFETWQKGGKCHDHLRQMMDMARAESTKLKNFLERNEEIIPAYARKTTELLNQLEKTWKASRAAYIKETNKRISSSKVKEVAKKADPCKHPFVPAPEDETGKSWCPDDRPCFDYGSNECRRSNNH